MIQANTLMKGNIVEYRDGDYKENVTLSTSDIAVIDFKKEIAEKYFGIPLSPEILLKCGFKKDNDGVLCLQYPDSNCKIYWIDFIQVAVGYAPMFNYRHIEYLHQFQNWYFANTGSEIKLSL